MLFNLVITIVTIFFYLQQQVLPTTEWQAKLSRGILFINS